MKAEIEELKVAQYAHVQEPDDPSPFTRQGWIVLVRYPPVESVEILPKPIECHRLG